MFLAEKDLAAHGVTIEKIDVEIAKGQNREDDYLAINPLGVLPSLMLDDGTILRESMAICRYFEARYPEPSLFGREPLEVARIEQWNRHAELELLVPVSLAFRNGHAFWNGRIEQVPEFAAVARKLVLERMAWFDRELAGREYLAGDRFSIADITALCAIDFGRIVDLRIAPEHVHLLRWRKAVADRPSAKA
jgi:glutathione S-transferase